MRRWHAVALEARLAPDAAARDRLAARRAMTEDEIKARLAARKTPGLFSKFDRDPALAQALVTHGRLQAERYLGLRDQSAALWEQLAQQVGMTGAHPSPRLAHALPWLPGRDRLAGGMVAPDVVTVEGAGASLRWHASEAEMEGRTMRIKGSTALRLGEGGWQLDATRLTDLEERQPPAAGRPDGPPPPAAGQEKPPRRRGGHGRDGSDDAGRSIH